MSFVRFVARRVLVTVPAALAVLVITFAMIRLVPGDPVQVIAGTNLDPQVAEELREQLGLNDPLLVQFFTYLENVLHGDLGTSFLTRQPVADVVAERLPNTLMLTAAGVLAGLLLSLPIGIASALRDAKRRRAGLSFTTVTTMLVATPDFLLATVLATVFAAVSVQIFPVAGAESWTSIVLPALALGISARRHPGAGRAGERAGRGGPALRCGRCAPSACPSGGCSPATCCPTRPSRWSRCSRSSSAAGRAPSSWRTSSPGRDSAPRSSTHRPAGPAGRAGGDPRRGVVDPRHQPAHRCGLSHHRPPDRPVMTTRSSAARRFLSQRLTKVGLVLLLIVAVVTVVGPLVYGASPTRTYPMDAYAGPSATYPLGTDNLGRDILARLPARRRCCQRPWPACSRSAWARSPAACSASRPASSAGRSTPS